MGWGIQMRAAFPNSALLVSQAVGHVVGMNGDRNDYSYVDFGACKESIDKFWAEDEMPLDGMICRQDGPVTLRYE